MLNLVLGFASCTWAETNQVYIVKKGDTLTRIAVCHKVSLTDLVEVNQIDPQAILSIGKQLVIPNPVIVTNSATTNAEPVLVIPLPELRNTDSNVVAQTFTNASTLTNEIKESTNSLLITNVISAPIKNSSHVEEIYVVKPGDNLYNIGKRFRVSVEELTQWNQISAKSILKIGQRLKIYLPSSVGSMTNADVVSIKPDSLPPKVEPLILDSSPKPEKKPEPPLISNAPTAPVHSPELTNSSVVVSNKTEEKKPELKTERIEKAEKVEKPEPEKKPEPPRPVAKPPPPKPVQPPPSPPPKPDSSKGGDNYIFLQRVKAKIDQPRVKPGRWKYIVVHHSGTRQGNAQIFDTYHRKVKRMENGLAYHFVIGNGSSTRDGEIEVGNRWMKQLQGGHLYSEYLNTIAIGICFVGDFNRDKPTAKQIAACIELIDYLKKICGNSKIKFCLHREINPRPTDCPGDRFPATLLHRRLD
ncbi:MAG: LysM peptidoglycan-binding domain-containing protein [Verrucomicrobiae bacterium]|nr:LysM peptidoglycan-binding domain-containing protein [Verrucomicrobiae bacterium]